MLNKFRSVFVFVAAVIVVVVSSQVWSANKNTHWSRIKTPPDQRFCRLLFFISFVLTRNVTFFFFRRLSILQIERQKKKQYQIEFKVIKCANYVRENDRNAERTENIHTGVYVIANAEFYRADNDIMTNDDDVVFQ